MTGRTQGDADRHAAGRLRRRAVAILRWATGWLPAGSVVARLGLSLRTMGDWMLRWREDRLVAGTPGRRRVRSGRTARRELYRAIHEAGPEVGVEVLRGRFPELARAEIRRLLWRYRRWAMRTGKLTVHALRWLSPGRVWAIDYTDSPSPIDGTDGNLLNVRDLASGKVLLSQPAAEATQATTVAALKTLFARHGAPLVAKSDNGGHFAGSEVRSLLEEHGVAQLLSPVRTPRYNGAVEAGIGALARRADYLALLDDHPGEWTADNVEGARRMANETSRPHGHARPTPIEAWRSRTPIGKEERTRFHESLRRHQAEVRAQWDHAPDDELNGRTTDQINRAAISRALVEHRILEYRRRRITPPFRFRKLARKR